MNIAELNYSSRVKDVRESIAALYLEAPGAVVDDVKARVERLIEASRPLRDPDPHGNRDRT